MVTAFFRPLLAKQLPWQRRKGQKSHLLKQKVCITPEFIGLYDASNLHGCPWPQTEEGIYAQKYLTPFIEKGVSTYVKNVQTDLRVMICGQLAFPITINESQFDNSYVCSPYSYFISYAKESLARVTNRWLFRSVNVLLWGIEKVFRRCQINKVIIVNNWLYSTNLYPLMQPQQIERIVHYLQSHFPDHAIVFPSIDPHTSETCHQTLQNKELTFIAAKQSYFIRPWETTLFESRLFKSDLKLLKNSGYEIIDEKLLGEEDIPRLIHLYKELYIEKFSHLNAEFTASFMQLALKENLLHFRALKKEGKIDGVVGFLERNGTMFCPFFGYDQTLSRMNVPSIVCSPLF